MPFDDEPAPYDLPEPPPEADRWAREAIGAAIEVHRILGPGHLEEVYEEAMAVEMKLRGIPFQRQVPIDVIYKGVPVGKGRIDFIVAEMLVVEIKACAALVAIHGVQVESYLATTKHVLALLLNFNVVKLKDGGIRRIVRSQ
jgi:GxxExxY protein